MTKTNDNLQEIKETLEQIRSANYSDISREIIDQIVEIQFANQEADRRVTGQADTHQAIKTYINDSLGEV